MNIQVHISEIFQSTQNVLQVNGECSWCYHSYSSLEYRDQDLDIVLSEWIKTVCDK